MFEVTQRSKTPLGQVRGLGSAKSGAAHWWSQRVTGGLLAVVSLWFLISFLSLDSYAQPDVKAWLSSLWVTGAMGLLVLTLTYHSHLGLEVVIEDYVPNKLFRVSLLLLSQLAHAAAAIFGVLSLIQIMLGAH